MLDHQHRDAELLLDVLDPERHVVGLVRVETGGRLVEQHQLRLGRKRAAKLDHLAHAIGQSGHEAVAIVCEVEQVDHALDRLALRDLGAAHARQEQ